MIANDGTLMPTAVPLAASQTLYLQLATYLPIPTNFPGKLLADWLTVCRKPLLVLTTQTNHRELDSPI
jgi:hypothetical protein